MSKFGLSQPVRRVEDLRFLRGAGQYIEDLNREGQLRAVFLRAPVAHGDIAEMDISEAQSAPGVHLVLTGKDLEGLVDHDMDSAPIEGRDGSVSQHPKRPWLAVDRVRFIGEAVALVVADTLDQARDAAEMIVADYDSLPAVTETALSAAAPVVHESHEKNLCYDWGIGDETATDAALAGAAHVVELDLINNKVISNPMETRGCLADWDGTKLTVHFNGQGPWDMKNEAAKRLGLTPENVAVHHPDVAVGSAPKPSPIPNISPSARRPRCSAALSNGSPSGARACSRT